MTVSCQGPTLGQGEGERQANLATWICGDQVLNIRNGDDVVNKEHSLCVFY